MTVVRIKWTRQHKTLCMVSSTWQTSVSGNDFCNRQSIIMPLFTRFSNMGFSGLWGYNDTPSGNSEFRMPPENTWNYSRDIAASFRESRAGGERQARREGEKEKQLRRERRKEGAAATFLLLGRKEFLTSWPSSEEQLQTLDKIKQLPEGSGVWAKAGRFGESWTSIPHGMFPFYDSFTQDRLRVAAPGSWNPERKPCRLSGHWN